MEATVVLATHSTHWLPQADHVVVVNDCSVIESGPFDTLNSASQYLPMDVSDKENGSDDVSEAEELDAQVSHSDSVFNEIAVNLEEMEEDRRSGDRKSLAYYFFFIVTSNI